MTAVYLDYAAATPLDPVVLQAMQPYLQDQFYNPSALYSAARLVHTQLELARSTVAQCLGARPSEIVFTAGGTESDNLAIHGVMRRYPQANLVIGAIEHDAVLAPAAHYERRQVSVTHDGIIDLTALEAAIDSKTVLVSLMLANNEIGTVQPLRKAVDLVEQERARRRQHGNELPIYIHTDACQAVNYIDVHVARLGVDMLTLGGGKIYGPKQSGILYIKGGLQLRPLIDGGGQERNLRSGTENVANCVGVATALQQTQSLRATEARRLQQLQQDCLKDIALRLPQAIVNGSLKRRLPNNIHLTIPGYDNERLLIELDELGIQAAAGSACSASSDEPSHVLRAIGLSDEAAQCSLRFTFGRQTTAMQLSQLVDALVRLVA